MWRETGEIFFQRINPDLSFVDSAINSVTPLIKYAILPELVGKWFSQQSNGSCSSSSNNVNDKSSSSSNAGYCYCGKMLT